MAEVTCMATARADCPELGIYGFTYQVLRRTVATQMHSRKIRAL